MEHADLVALINEVMRKGFRVMASNRNLHCTASRSENGINNSVDIVYFNNVDESLVLYANMEYGFGTDHRSLHRKISVMAADQTIRYMDTREPTNRECPIDTILLTQISGLLSLYDEPCCLQFGNEFLRPIVSDSIVSIREFDPLDMDFSHPREIIEPMNECPKCNAKIEIRIEQEQSKNRFETIARIS